jgi:hypothetical protein
MQSVEILSLNEKLNQGLNELRVNEGIVLYIEEKSDQDKW